MVESGASLSKDPSRVPPFASCNRRHCSAPVQINVSCWKTPLSPVLQDRCQTYTSQRPCLR